MEKDQKLWKGFDGTVLWELGLVLMGGTMLGKSLINFLLMGGHMFLPAFIWPEEKLWGGVKWNSQWPLSKGSVCHCYTQCPQFCSLSHCQAMPALRSPWTCAGRSGSVSCGSHYSFLLGLVYTGVLFSADKSCFPSPGGKFSCGSTLGDSKGDLSRGSMPYQSPYPRQSTADH